MEWNKDISKVPENTAHIVVCFDNGDWCPFDKQRWPRAMVTGWIELPISIGDNPNSVKGSELKYLS